MFCLTKHHKTDTEPGSVSVFNYLKEKAVYLCLYDNQIQNVKQ